MGSAYDARCGVVLPSHTPQFLAFGEGQLDPAVAAGNGAFGRDFGRHSPNITTTAQGGGFGQARRVCSVGLYLGCGVGKSLHPSSPGQRLAPRKGPLNAENAVRTTGLLTARRNPGDRTDPVCQLLTTEATTLLSKGNYPPSAGLWLRPLPRAGVFCHWRSHGAQHSHRYRWIPTGRHAGRPAGSLPPPRQLRRQAIPRRVLVFGRA